MHLWWFGGWVLGGNNVRTCCVHVMHNMGFTETIPTSFIGSKYNGWSPTESMKWMINCCLPDDTAWQSIMHCSSCSPCRLLTSPIFLNKPGYSIVETTTTKWDVAASKCVDDYDSCNGKGGSGKKPMNHFANMDSIRNELDVASLKTGLNKCMMMMMMMLMYQHVNDLIFFCMNYGLSRYI